MNNAKNSPRKGIFPLFRVQWYGIVVESETIIDMKDTKNNSAAVCRLISVGLFMCLTANLTLCADWATDLVWSGGGLWTKRIPVTIENTSQRPMAGTPIAVELPIGLPAKELRVTKTDGTELVYALAPDGKTLQIPVEAEPGQKADYFIYFGNEKAIPVPDMLEEPSRTQGSPRTQGSSRSQDTSRSPEARFELGVVENIPFNIISAETDWRQIDKGDYLCRGTFRVINTTDAALDNVPVLMTLRGTQAHGLLGTLTDLSLADGSPVTLLDPENFRLSCKISVPAKTAKYFNVYYRFDETNAGTPSHLAGTPIVIKDSDTAHPELQRAIDPLAGFSSLVRNGDIEQGTGDVPEGWNRSDISPAEGVRHSIERSPELVRFGTQCLRLDVPKNVQTSWRGWTQRIEIKPNHSYLVQGWLKCIDIESARIYIHFHTADGRPSVRGGQTSINQDISGTTDWTRVAEIIPTPSDAKFMTIHLTMNSSGTLLHDNIAVVDGLFAEQVDRESYYNGDIRFWQVPAVMKVFPQTIPPKWVRESKQEDMVFQIEAARNDKEPLQIAVRGASGTGEVNVTPPKHSSGFELDQCEISTAGYVAIDYPSNYYNTRTPGWYRKSPTSAPGSDGWAGLWPDPLLPTGTVNVKANQTESVWITWAIPKDAPAKTYTGSIRTSLSPTEVSLPIEIIVRDFTVPDAPSLAAIYDVRFRLGGAQPWGNAEQSPQRALIDLMTGNRLSPDAVTPTPRLTFQDDKPVYDWTEFDAVAEWFFNERNIRVVYMPRTFYAFGWGHPPSDFFGERPYPGERPFTGTDFSKLRPEYKAKYQAALREFWNHLKEKGWADRFVLYISDEPHYWVPHIIQQMKAVCDMIHEVDPAIPIYCSTWRFIPEWAETLDVWGIGHYGAVPVATMNEMKARGSRIWFTTDGMLCLDTPYNAIERLLPYYCFKYGADAYEFWGISWLTRDPYVYGAHTYINQSSTPGESYWVRYPNGDGYLLYPPQQSGGRIVSSVRFEQAREGMEDFEYFTMLSQLIEKGKQSGKDVAKAEAVLAEAMNMVDSPTAIGRYSTKILPNPYRLYEVRRKVAETIEGF